MMCSNSGKVPDLVKVLEMRGIFCRGKCGAIVRKVSLRDDSNVSAVLLELLLCVNCLMRVQVYLFLDEDIAGSMIDKESATSILGLGVFFALCVAELSFC